MTETSVTPTYQPMTLDQLTRAHVELVLELFGWHISRSSEALGVDRRTLYRMIARYDLKRPTELQEANARAECVGCGKLAPEGDPPAEPGYVWACSPACSRKGAGVSQ